MVRSKLGEDNLGCLGFRSDRKGLQLRVPNLAGQERGQTAQKDGSLSSGDSAGSCISVTKKSHRGSKPSRRSVGVLLNVLSSSQEKWRSQTNSKPSSSQQAPQKTALQDGSSWSCSQGSSSRLLGSVNRFDRRLFACSTENQSHEVFKIYDSRFKSNFSVPLPLFWFGDSPESVHQAGDNNWRLPQEAGGDHLSVSGRLVDRPQEQTTFTSAEKSAITDSGEPGVPGEFHQIRPGTGSALHLLGRKLQPGDRSGGSIPRPDEPGTGDRTGTDKTEVRAGRGHSRGPGYDGVVHRTVAMGTAAHATNPNVPATFLETFKQGSRCEGSSQRSSSSTSQLVVGQAEHISNPAVQTATGSVDFTDGREQVRLGGIPDRGSQCPGLLECGGSPPPHQQLGDESSKAVPRTVCPFTEGTSGDGQIRQYDRCNVLEQAGRDQISHSVHADLGSAPVVQEAEHRAQSFPHIGSGQQAGRLAVQAQDSGHRVVSQQECGTNSVPDDRAASNRPLCVSGECSAPNVLFMGPGPSSMGNRCSINLLERHDSICLSTDSAFTTNSAQSQVRTVQSTFDSSYVATENMVPQVARNALGGSDSASRNALSANSAEGQGSAPRTRNIPSDSLAALRHRLGDQGFSKTASKLISNAVRKSTRAVYSSRFQEFVRWCNRGKVDPFTAPIAMIANFLAKLYKRGLSYSTVCGYRSAISNYHDEIDGRKIGENKHLIRLLKGIFNLRPPSRTLPPKWDLGTVLQALTKAPYEPFNDVPLQFATWKTAFLLAIVSAARGSDVAKMGCGEPHLRFQNNPEGIKLIPRSLRKQDRPGHFLKEMFIPKFTSNRRLDPVRAVRLYLKRVAGRRGTLKSLLVTYGAGKVKAPSAQTIARWIRTVIQSAPGALQGRKGPKAHSTRSMSTSVAFQKGVSVLDVMRAADWSSDVVFANFYLKEVQAREGEFGRTVLETGARTQ